jgi:hypothetical protein
MRTPEKRGQPACETCHGAGVYHTGVFVGDDEYNLRSVVSPCPDCDPNCGVCGRSLAECDCVER